MMNKRIKERRKQLELTQLKVAIKIGVSKATISLWESGDTSPLGENLYKLSKVLKAPSIWLLYGREAKTALTNADWAGSIESWYDGTTLHRNEAEIPFFTEVELAAGDGAIAFSENHGPKLRFAKSTLKRQGVEVENAACVKINGNSMEAVLPNGSTVGVDTASKSIKDGKMYAINHDGMLRVKLVYRLPGGGIRLRSYNSDEYPDERYDSEQAQQINIIGKIFWYSVLL